MKFIYYKDEIPVNLDRIQCIVKIYDNQIKFYTDNQNAVFWIINDQDRDKVFETIKKYYMIDIKKIGDKYDSK